jgi:hypothetical protein
MRIGCAAVLDAEGYEIGGPDKKGARWSGKLVDDRRMQGQQIK